MPRSTKHKSHRQSKHSSRDYSDSEEDVKMKEKSSKDENLVKVNRDPAYGEKRKSSSQVREGREVKNIIEHDNGGAFENYFSSKRRKENSDSDAGGDRWNGGGDELGKSDRVMESDTIKGESKSKEMSNKGDGLRNKSKKYESGNTGEKRESLAYVVVEEDEGRNKTEFKRKSERDYSVRKEGKESKDKDSRQEKGQETNRGDEAKLADVDVAKRLELQQVDLIVERQFKRGRENSDFPVQDDSQNSEFEKELDKKARRRGEGSSDRVKHREAFKDGEERGTTSRSDRIKEVKYRDDKHKDETYADDYLEDDHKDDRQRDEKYHKETSKDNKHRDEKHVIDGEKDVRRREDRHREDDGDSRTKDERHREDGERDTKWRYDKHREGSERDSRNKEDRRHEDGDRDRRRRDERYHEDGIKNGRHGDEKYYEDGDKDKLGSNSRKEDANRDTRHKEEKHRDDVERESRHNDGKKGSDFDRGKSLREAKYRDERTTKDRTVDKSDLRHFIDDGYVADYHSRKSNAYKYSPTHDERTARNRDDQGVRRPNEKGDYNDNKSQSTNDQRFDAEKGRSDAKIDSTPNRGQSTSRNANAENNSSHNRRRSSPSSTSVTQRDRYRLSKQDESKYSRDYGYEERYRHNLSSTRDYTSTVGGSEKASLSWSMEKQVQKEDSHLGDFGERRLKSDSRSSPMQLTVKSPATSIDRRQFSMSDARRSMDVEESTQRSGGSREMNEYSVKEGKGRYESGMDTLRGNELSQADSDALFVPSPFTRNNHLSGSSKSFPPPPHFRAEMESPLIGSAEDENRFKSNSRYRRSGDPNMGRMHGNAWRGVPSWTSPVVNGFMPFPHAPPPVNYHSVMQPFQTPIYGIRPSVDMNHPAPYHISNTDRFSGPGRPMGWCNPVDDPCPPLHAWDASNASLRDESHIYGRPGWDHSRNLPDGQGWDTTGDLWKGPNRTASLEMSSSEKENYFAQNTDEVSASQSIQPIWNEQTLPGQRAASSDVNEPHCDSLYNAIKAPESTPEGTSYAAKISEKDDVLLCNVYLSKLDISVDLTEPDLLNQCSGFCDTDQIIVSDIEDSKILFVEEAGVESHQILRYFMSTPKDESVFMRAMSLYERQKDNFDKVVAGERFSIHDPHQEGPNTEDNTAEKQSSAVDILSAEDAPALANTDVDVNPMNTLLKVEGSTEAAYEKPILPAALAVIKSEEPVSTLGISDLQVDLASDLVQWDHIVEEKHLSVESNKGFGTSLPHNMKNDGNIEELNLDGTECVTLHNSDLFSEVSEAMMPESLVSGSVNLSRIHHSPESTH